MHACKLAVDLQQPYQKDPNLAKKEERADDDDLIVSAHLATAEYLDALDKLAEAQSATPVVAPVVAARTQQAATLKALMDKANARVESMLRERATGSVKAP